MDENRLVLLMKANERSLYRVARTILWNDSDCADAIQEAMLKAWRHRYKLINQEKFMPWITKILINECRNIQRRIRKEKKIVAVIMDRTELDKRTKDSESNLQDALMSLPDEQRVPIVLHYLEGYPYKTIADILGMNTKLVKSRLYEGRRKLQNYIFGQGGKEN